MKKRRLWLIVLSLIISICMCFCLAACDSCNSCSSCNKDDGKDNNQDGYQDDVTPTVLGVPTVSVDTDGKATWNEVENASGYAYKIDDGDEQIAAEREVQLLNGQSIKVKATGDGINFADGEYSDAVTYTAQSQEAATLTAPTVSIKDGTASWTAIPNADGYVYQIRENGASAWGLEQTTEETTVTNLTEGQSIRVKAHGDGISFADSGWSTVATVPASGTTPDPVITGKPEVTIDDEGAASWTAVADADWYEIEIDGVYAGISSNTYYGTKLTDGQTIRVRAIKDLGNEKYSEGEWSALQTYEEPVSDIPNGIKFVFGDGASYNSNAYSATELTNVFKGASAQTVGFNSVTSTGAVSQGNNSSDAKPLKFGSSKNKGYVTLSLKKEVVMVVVDCVKYSSDDITLTVGGETAKPAAERGNLTFTLTTPTASVRIESDKRCLIYGITVYFGLPEALDVPEVKIDPYGVARWDEVKNASGYICTVNGVEKTVTSREVQLNDNDTITVTAVGDGINYLSSVSEEQTYTEKLIPLDKPAVTISRGIAYWDIDENASGYVYKIDGGEEKDAPADGAVTLTDGQTITVKALGDRIFNESQWSDEATYTRPAAAAQLGAPVITIERDGTASWTHNPSNYVKDATGYKYTVDGVEKEITEEPVKLKDGEKIAVNALGDNVHFTDSTAAELTYLAPADKFDAPENLTVEIEGEEKGVLILKWDAVDGASGYAYIVNGDTEHAVTVNDNTVMVDLTKIDAARLGDAWAFQVLTLGDGNDEIAADGDYSTRREGSDYCDLVEFRVERGGDDKVYSVSEISKVINYFGSTTLPDDTFKVSGTVFANTAYGENIDITLIENETKIVLSGATMAQDFSFATENLFEGFTVNAAGKLSVNKADGEKRVINSSAEVQLEGLDDRYALAEKTLNAMDALQDDTEHREGENLVLPVRLYGVNVDWTVEADDEEVFTIAENGTVTVRQPAAGDGDAPVMLTAELYYGEMEDIYENQLMYMISVPEIVQIELDTPKISIDPKTGVATWTTVKNVVYYHVTYYGFVDDDYTSEYVAEDLLLEPDDKFSVQLQNKLWITVQALGDGRYYADSEIASKQYTYYPETVTPDGTPLTFDMNKLTQTGELANPTYIFGFACDNAASFISASASRVELGNSDSNGAVSGKGFIKVGSASADGTITLNFNKKVNGVIITACQWSKNDNDKVSVNGSDEQTASKNGWGTMTFNFTAAKASETVEIVTNNRVFIKSITVYLAD